MFENNQGLSIRVISERHLSATNVSAKATVNVATNQFGLARSQLDWRQNGQQDIRIQSTQRIHGQTLSPLGDTSLSIQGSHTGVEESTLHTGELGSALSVTVKDQLTGLMLAGPGSTGTVTVNLVATAVEASTIHDSGGHNQVSLSVDQTLALETGTMVGFEDPAQIAVDIQLRSTGLGRSELMLGSGNNQVSIEAGFGVGGSESGAIQLSELWPEASARQVRVKAEAVGMQQSRLLLGNGDDNVAINARFDHQLQETLRQKGSPVAGESNQIALWDSLVDLGGGTNSLTLEGAVINSSIVGGTGSDQLAVLGAGQTGPGEGAAAALPSPATTSAAAISGAVDLWTSTRQSQEGLRAAFHLPSRSPAGGNPAEPFAAVNPRLEGLLSRRRTLIPGRPGTPDAPQAPADPAQPSAIPPTTEALALWNSAVRLGDGNNAVRVQGAVINSQLVGGAGDDQVLVQASGRADRFDGSTLLNWSSTGSSGTPQPPVDESLTPREKRKLRLAQRWWWPQNENPEPLPIPNLQPAQLSGLALSNARVELGEGNNQLIVKGILLNSEILGGSGKDEVSVVAAGSNGTQIDTGGGNDWLLLHWAPWQGMGAGLTVRSGDGADAVIFTGLEGSIPDTWDQVTGLPVLADLNLLQGSNDNNGQPVADQLGWLRADGALIWLSPSGLDGIGNPSSLPVLPQGSQLLSGSEVTAIGSAQLAVFSNSSTSTLVLLLPGSELNWVPVAFLGSAGS